MAVVICADDVFVHSVNWYFDTLETPTTDQAPPVPVTVGYELHEEYLISKLALLQGKIPLQRSTSEATSSSLYCVW